MPALPFTSRRWHRLGLLVLAAASLLLALRLWPHAPLREAAPLSRMVLAENGELLRMTLASDGRAYGNGGCNHWFAPYTLDGEHLSFGKVGKTRKLCAPALMEQEQRFLQALDAACPDGIDGYFENVGGYILDAVLLRANAFARIALCGMIAGYDGAPLPMANPALMLINRMKVEGFIVSEHMEVWPDALKELGTLVGTGKLRPRETIAQGIAAAPEAFLGLLKGKNFGKQLVKLV